MDPIQKLISETGIEIRDLKQHDVMKGKPRPNYWNSVNLYSIWIEALLLAATSSWSPLLASDLYWVQLDYAAEWKSLLGNT